ncbi:DNA-binding response regulator [Cryobacterium sp. LW097]|uniref:response regulator n=1 Tax=unclassified Cryobacterium TaxID=2649013 RepID=UPI000B4CBC25|nr:MULTISPECIES: response regulator transcription factor [unclassified Cryobacterium]ASD23527.1 DNA-binding response regulator [Cryobacterium sp. LW097]TFC53724.1 response regulator transcription factor [Cryobacterium sp. TMB3-1-2]TFC58946.1 response regulator transcription factor [Cryobacterium sp. TMB1-7]TFC75143.1 response regulator transcription factor [Cryobacterium sp. TMB3-15]TFC75279.1 response regulator transcription factor [Cryobacterium sp. TMB3-10]
MSVPIRVLLVDDQALVRAGFRIILESEPGIVVVGEAVDGAAAIRQAGALRPDVVCMDVQMPGMDGLTATRAIVADPTSRAAVLVLTTFDREDYLFAALQHGASGFLLKNASPESLVEAVQVLARGDALLSPEITRRVIARFAGAFSNSSLAAAPDVALAQGAHRPEPKAVGMLTDREREVFELIALGLANAEIAARLYLGEATVKTHVSKVLQKLDLRDRIQAVVYAYEHGIVVPGAAQRQSTNPH